MNSNTVNASQAGHTLNCVFFSLLCFIYFSWLRQVWIINYNANYMRKNTGILLAAEYIFVKVKHRWSTDQIKAVRKCVLTGKVIDKYCKTRFDISAFYRYSLHLHASRSAFSYCCSVLFLFFVAFFLEVTHKVPLSQGRWKKVEGILAGAEVIKRSSGITHGGCVGS